ncbi:hypothetical protein B9Z65_1881 [Elsinoe australis]|uniref:Uncharacterized protein n=1 Tax=Elsinoe australis TaxID=40998 RepID=A0A2P7YL49_9PEZI|nr:hypothetical protein B9Z65_1881 [Elsinoe australis]
MLTLINHQSLQQNQSQLDPTVLQRAVVVIYGLNQDPGTYMATTLSALSQQISDPNVNLSSVAIMDPYFANGDDKGTGYPWSTKDGSTSSALANPTISSFKVLDQLIKYFDNQTVFPNMKHIVIAGHSLGAQAVARYTQIGDQFATKSKVTYWIGNPKNFAWMSTDRPISSKVQDCPTYDVYRDGYTNFTQYPMTYATDLVAAGLSAILANFKTKSKVYARSTQDFGDTSSNCNPFTTVDYVDAGHDAGTMFAAPAGRARLVTDNFYGDNVIAPDFGYPRLQAGDDPLPDPKLVNPNRQYTDKNTYADNMKYQGC